MPRVPYKMRQFQCMSITFPEYDFGVDIGETLCFRLPTGYHAELLKIGVSVTEAFECDSTEANIKLGTTSSAAAYAQLNIPDNSAVQDFIDETDDTNAIIDKHIPANTLLMLTLTQSTNADGLDAGKGLPMLMFELSPGGAF